MDEKKKFYPYVVFEMGNPVKIVSWENHSISNATSLMIACAVSQVELNFPVTILLDSDIKNFQVKIYYLNDVRFNLTLPLLSLFSTDVEDQYDIKGKTFLDIKKEFVLKLKFFINEMKQSLENKISLVDDSKIGLEKQLKEFNVLNIENM